MSEPIEIKGAPRNPYQQITARYSYDNDRSKCPACGGVGIPWRGWFSCDCCDCLAVVSSGDAFLPVRWRRRAGR